MYDSEEEIKKATYFPKKDNVSNSLRVSKLIDINIRT
jgi:hypothetical protein